RAVSSAAGSAFTLQPQQKANAAFLSTHYDPTDAATAYLNGFYTHRTSLQRWSGSEYQGAEDQFAADIGLTLQIPRNRTLGVDVSASGDSNSTTQYGGSRSMYNHAAGQERLLSASFTGQGELAQL